MKILKHTLIVLFILSSAILLAQEDEEKEIKYIFGDRDKPAKEKEKIQVSGFAAPLMGFSAIGDEFAFFMGGGGAVLFNQKFYVGAFGEGLATRHYTTIRDYNSTYPTKKTVKTSFGYGGFWLGYIHKSKSPVHFGASTRIGMGSIYYDQYYNDKDNNYQTNKDLLEVVFVMIPQVEAEFNLLKWMKMNIGLGYRIVAGFNTEYLGEPLFDKKDFNKPEGTITLMFGYFK